MIGKRAFSDLSAASFLANKGFNASASIKGKQIAATTRIAAIRTHLAVSGCAMSCFAPTVQRAKPLVDDESVERPSLNCSTSGGSPTFILALVFRPRNAAGPAF